MRFLIATDVAARGIDIAGLPYVVNMTLPDRDEDYIHRVGRVGAWPGCHLPPAITRPGGGTQVHTCGAALAVPAVCV